LHHDCEGDEEQNKVYILEEPGGQVQKVELPVPTPGRNHVVLRIYARGVNPLDTKIRARKGAHAKQPLPAVLGLDMAGIGTVGPGVNAFLRVYGMASGVGGLKATLADVAKPFTLTACGKLILADDAGPPSPELPSTPLPTKVLIAPLGETVRTRWLPVPAIPGCQRRQRSSHADR
jgi:hypothetical protein